MQTFSYSKHIIIQICLAEVFSHDQIYIYFTIFTNSKIEEHVITLQFFLFFSSCIFVKPNDFYLPVSIPVLLLFSVPLFLQVQQELKYGLVYWHEKYLNVEILYQNKRILPQLTALQLFSQFEKLRKVNRFICAEGLPPKKSRNLFKKN